MTYVRVKITRKAGWEADSGASGGNKRAVVELVDSVGFRFHCPTIDVQVRVLSARTMASVLTAFEKL